MVDGEAGAVDLEEGEVVLDRGAGAGQRRLAGETGAPGRGDADQRVAPRCHRRQQRGEPGLRGVAGQEVERQAAPGERAGRHRRHLGRGAGEGDDERAGRGGMLEGLGLGGAGVPGARADPELAVPVAEGEEGEAGGLGPVGRDQRRVAVLAEALHPAVGEADAQRAGGRRGPGHAGGEVAARPPLGAGRGQEDGAGRDLQRRRREQRPDVRRRIADDPVPEVGGGEAVVVAGQEPPAETGVGPHGVQRLAQRRGRRRLRVEGVAGDEDVGDAVGASRRGEPADARVAGLAQPAAQVLGEAAEGLAEVQVGGVQQADHAGSPAGDATGSAQRVLTRRTCSTVVQRASSRRGDAKTRASALARETATLMRLSEKRNSMPRGTSSIEEAVIDTRQTGASWPWNLSTVPTRTRSGSAARSAFTWAL